MKSYVLYHAGCSDGFCAAWAAKKSLPSAEFIPVHYGQPLPPIENGSQVFILDFSYQLPILRGLIANSDRVVVLDHHKTAQAELSPLVEEQKYKNCTHGWVCPEMKHYVCFDMGKSGGRLAWQYFRAGEPAPWLVDYTEDRDLWRWKLPHSKAINAALRSYPMDFATWDQFGADDPFRFAPEGGAILRRERQIVDDHVRHAVYADVAGHTVPCVNATVLSSEIAGELAKGEPFGACWFQRKDGKKVFSLRSDENGMDVSAVAKKMGGGGHKNAAGFEQ